MIIKHIYVGVLRGIECKYLQYKNSEVQNKRGNRKTIPWKSLFCVLTLCLLYCASNKMSFQRNH